MSIRRSCDLMRLRRATWYYASQARDSSAVRARIRELAILRPRFGYERLHILYGEPSRTAEYVSRAGPTILVYKWNEDRTDEGVTMYATDGASEVLGTGERSCEFFLGLTPAADDIVEALAEAAMEGNGSGQVPSSGDSITLALSICGEVQRCAVSCSPMAQS